MTREYKNIKIVLVGDIYVGKTSLAHTFAKDIYMDKYQSNVSAHYHVKHMDDIKVTIQLWDTAGQERFRCFLPLYMRDALCVIVVYDVTNKDSFRNVENFWLDYIEKNSFPNLVKFLVGNKADSNDRAIEVKEGRQLASINKMLFIETSAKFGINVNTLFQEAAKAVLIAQPEKEKSFLGIQLAPSKKETKRDCFC